MSVGLSFHIGLNRIDPGHYGTDGALGGCESDASAMKALAQSRGFRAELILNEAATAEAILRRLRDASDRLGAGDTCLITYAGHGGEVPDTNGDEGGPPDSTWCVYDRMLVDDELYRCWAAFSGGVRIIVVSDSCHSGTVARMLAAIQSLTASRSLGGRDMDRLLLDFGVSADSLTFRGPRTLPLEIQRAVVSNHRVLYESVQRRGLGSESIHVAASLLLLAACQDDQLAADGPDHGLFTSKLLEVWNDGRYRGSYRSFFDEVCRLMPLMQRPNFFPLGVGTADLATEQPFQVAGGTTTGAGKKDPFDPPALPSETSSIEARLVALKREREALRFGEPPSDDRQCVLSLRLPRSVISGMSDVKVYSFLQNEGVDTIMRAYLGATAVAAPTGSDLSVSCKADSPGGVQCQAEARIHF